VAALVRPQVLSQAKLALPQAKRALPQAKWAPPAGQPAGEPRVRDTNPAAAEQRRRRGRLAPMERHPGPGPHHQRAAGRN
jgi:hypothetical protein